MTQDRPTVEAEITHNVPALLKRRIGEIILLYSRLEHDLSSLSYVLLQLNKAEARIALKTPRAAERLDMALDLLAIKKLTPTTDAVALRTKIERCTTLRDQVAHGLFLKHPETGELFLRLARGSWPKDMTPAERVSRVIFPQSIRYGVEQADEALATITEARAGVSGLGQEVDGALQAFPERFRPPAPNLNPLGHRKPKAPAGQRAPSQSR